MVRRKSGNNPFERPKISRRLRRIVPRVVFYAVVSDQIQHVIEFFRTPAQAEAMLESVLEDEPSWREILYVEPVELVTGGEN